MTKDPGGSGRGRRRLATGKREENPTRPTVWVAVALMLIGAIVLVAGIGSAGLWIGVIAVGIALVAIDSNRHRRNLHS
jgi:hypothetical protein